MKTSKLTHVFILVLISTSLSFLYACDSNSEENLNLEKPNLTITDTDKEALLFMLEEEKLARDTYVFLDNLWALNQFSNIKISEQTHMNAIENLLKQYKIPYNILSVGKFKNVELQAYYNQFITSGSESLTNALKIGATIEDLDIVDLQKYIKTTNNSAVIAVLENLQCGSRNHLRSFLKGLEFYGDNYTPQFLSIEGYNNIINSLNEKCGKI